jgi:hypothetical protein
VLATTAIPNSSKKEKSSLYMITLYTSLLAIAEWIWALLVGILCTFIWLRLRSQKQDLLTVEAQAPKDLTLAFQSAIPIITQELNLEVATAQYVEKLVVEDASFWGTNRVEIEVLVTYRYHIRLRETWQLDDHGHTLTVVAPRLRAAEPPSIHTDQLKTQLNRGAFRLSPTDLRDQALQQLTPMLIGLAEDERRISLIRETARSAAKAFVRQWLMREGEWAKRFHSIELEFETVPTPQPVPPSLPKNIDSPKQN